MTDDSILIQPKSVPLSHIERTPVAGRATRRNTAIGVFLAAAVVTIVLVLAYRPDTATPTETAQSNADPESPSATAEAADRGAAVNADRQQISTNSKLPPYAALKREQAREAAQKELSRFVEHQIALEESMQVDQWAPRELDEARQSAESGDKAFLNDDFDTAIAAYQEATAKVQALISKGEQRYQEAMKAGLGFVDARDESAAREQLGTALVIKANDAAALAAMARADKLPQIIGLLRTARNHELQSRWSDALATYDQILALDGATTGIETLKQQARQGTIDTQIAAHLSSGFDAMNKQQFNTARRAFNEALKLAPGNEVALGGLQQVSNRNDLATIEQHRLRAVAARNTEDWAAANEAYEAILALDANIAFARNGRAEARAQIRAADLLTRIKSEPHRLSNDKLFRDGQKILAEATELTHQGPRLRELERAVGDLMQIYSQPVDVVFTSDNQTEVIVSNVGVLGTFENKAMSLRPGLYTVRGSRNGCQDIHREVEILPGVDAIDVRCENPLTHR